jgi:thioredoxin
MDSTAIPTCAMCGEGAEDAPGAPPLGIACGIRLEEEQGTLCTQISGIVAAEKDKMSNSVELTDATFSSEIENHNGLAVVDFWAPWCGPCRMVGPVLDELAGEYAGKAKVAKVDVDQNQSLAQRFGVRSIPLILFFKDGKVVDQVLGAVPKAQLAAKFQQHAA